MDRSLIMLQTGLDGTIEAYLPNPTHQSISSYWIKLSPPSTPKPTSLSGYTFHLSSDLSACLQPHHHHLLTARLSECRTPQAFFSEVQAIICQHHNNSHQHHLQITTTTTKSPITSPAPPPRPSSFYSSLRRDLHHLGWHRITHLSPDLSQITVIFQDQALRTHFISINLPADYPAAKPVIVHVDLPPTSTNTSSSSPCAFTFSWSSDGTSTLSDIISQYESSLHKYQTLWNVLDDIDNNCWVIEPSFGNTSSSTGNKSNNNSSSSSSSTIPRSCCYRRLALLEKNSTVVTLTVTLSPLDPTAFPLDYRFLGSETMVAPLRKKLIDGYNSWRNDVLLRQNLEDILGVQLPQSRCYNQLDGIEEGEKSGGGGGGGGGGDVMHDAEGMNCAICYSYKLLSENGDEKEGEGGAAPEEYCDNPSCGKPFHKSCLAEWLKSDTSTKQAFDKLYGACPYCGAPVSVDVMINM